MLSGSSNAAARTIIAPRLADTVLACRLNFGAKVARIEELARAIVPLIILLNILKSEVDCLLDNVLCFGAFYPRFLEDLQFHSVGEKWRWADKLEEFQLDRHNLFIGTLSSCFEEYLGHLILCFKPCISNKFSSLRFKIASSFYITNTAAVLVS